MTGEAKDLLTDVQYQSQVKRVVFDVSDAGLLVAQTGGGVALSQLGCFDRNGKEMAVVGKPDVYGNVALASNGRSVAESVTDIEAHNRDVWTYDRQAGSAKPLTFDPAQDQVSIWSPDSTQVVFSSNRQYSSNSTQSNIVLYMKNSDGRRKSGPSCEEASTTFRMTGPGTENTSCTCKTQNFGLRPSLR